MSSEDPLEAGDARRAAEDGERAVRVLTTPSGMREPDLAAALACTGAAHGALGDSGAEALLERAVALFERIEADPRDRATAHFALARA